MRTHYKAGKTIDDSVVVAMSPTEQAQIDTAEAAWAAGAENRAWAEIRARRDALLRISDWRFLADTPAKHVNQAWRDYRQSLRDITAAPDPDRVVWPLRPA